jgi:hypothetical protein
MASALASISSASQPQHRLAGIGQHRAFAMALEQHPPGRRFQRAQATAYGRMADTQRPRGRTQRLVARHRQEHFTSLHSIDVHLSCRRSAM